MKNNGEAKSYHKSYSNSQPSYKPPFVNRVAGLVPSRSSYVFTNKTTTFNEHPHDETEQTTAFTDPA